MPVTHRLALFSSFVLILTGSSCAAGLNLTDITNHNKLPAGRRLHKNSDAIKPSFSGKMTRRDMMVDVAKAVLRKENQDLETLRFSCGANEYYDKNTQNCENCIVLCKNFNPKMCQVNCPGTDVALKFKLPQLAGELRGLNAMHEEQSHEIMTLSTDNAEMKMDIEQLYVLFTAVVVMCAIIIICMVSIAVVMFKRFKRQKSKEEEIYDSNSETSPSSSFNPLKKNIQDCAESHEERTKLIIPERQSDVKCNPIQQGPDHPTSSALAFNQVSPAEDASNETKTDVVTTECFRNQTAQHSPAHTGATQPKHR